MRAITRQQHIDHDSGFTIVELLIVIVVIAILAAIVIVAYNGVQQRAQTSAIASGFESISKAFRLKATTDGQTTWWIDNSSALTGSSNPNVADIIAGTNLKNYLQSAPVVSGLTTSTSYWWYDNDGDTYDSSSACTTPGSTGGVNIVFANVSQSTALQVDKALDDGNLNCGKMRFNSSVSLGDRIFYSLSDQQNI